MHKLILFIVVISSLIPHLCFGETVRVIGKLDFRGNLVRLVRPIKGDEIFGILKNQTLKETIAKLDHGDDVIAQGHITYVSSSNEGQIQQRPVFVIESIRPVSLKRLGRIEPSQKDFQSSQTFSLAKYEYAPKTFPLSTEAASSITLTTSLMLLQTLTASPNSPHGAQQINSGLILFAGILATGAFIYEQIVDTKSEYN